MPKTEAEPNPIMTGHCGNPQTSDPAASHKRCADHGSGSRANPEKRFHPCPCPCHLAHSAIKSNTVQNVDGTWGEVDVFTCGCGGIIAEAPVFGLDSDGDPVYVHVDKHTHRMLYRECRA